MGTQDGFEGWGKNLCRVGRRKGARLAEKPREIQGEVVKEQSFL